MKELLDFILVRLYYRLFVRPRPAGKAAPEWNIDLPGMQALYKGSAQNPLAGLSMTFYLAGDGEGGKTLCGALNPIPAVVQAVLDRMYPRQSKRLMRRLIEEGDRVFRAAWERQ